MHLLINGYIFIGQKCVYLDINIVLISCNKIQVIWLKYHYTVIIKNKETICNPSWGIDLKSFIMRWKGQCKKILFYAIDVLLIDVLLIDVLLIDVLLIAVLLIAVLLIDVLLIDVLLIDVLLIDVLLIDALLTVVFYIIIQIYQDWT